MKIVDWNEAKNMQLRMERDISFDEVMIAIEGGNLLDVIRHPNIERYTNQKIFVVEIRNYAYLVPFVEDNEKIFQLD